MNIYNIKFKKKTTAKYFRLNFAKKARNMDFYLMRRTPIPTIVKNTKENRAVNLGVLSSTRYLKISVYRPTLGVSLIQVTLRDNRSVVVVV